jgi:hypothetical protein
MRRLVVLGLAAALALTGCRSSRCDLVEAELRTKDRQLRESQDELLFQRSMNQSLEAALRERQCVQPPAPTCRSGFGPSIKDVQLGRGTGGIDDDNRPGDEGILVVVVPRDVDTSPVKVAGTLKVAAFEVTTEGLKIPLSTWDVSATELRKSWRTGLLSSGYHVSLPFQRFPTNPKVRIIATFLPLEGGIYEAEKDVTVRLATEIRPCPPNEVLPPTPVPGPGGGLSLPPPTPIPPTSSNYGPAQLGPPRANQN